MLAPLAVAPGPRLRITGELILLCVAVAGAVTKLLLLRPKKFQDAMFVCASEWLVNVTKLNRKRTTLDLRKDISPSCRTKDSRAQAAE